MVRYNQEVDNMNERLELIIKELKRTLQKYPTCDECDMVKWVIKDHIFVTC